MFGSNQQRSNNTSGLDALLHRPRPTAWEQFLRRPCVYLARELYYKLQSPPSPCPLPQADSGSAPAPAPAPVSVVCISDTHNTQPTLPDGDILIHAGDLTQSGTLSELEAAVAWLRRQPHPVKIVVAGNHDLLLDPGRDSAAASSGRDGGDGVAETPVSRRSQLPEWGDIIYLEDEETTVALAANNGRRRRRLRVYGSPRTPRHGSWAFQYPRAADIWGRAGESQVPPGIDVLVTHGPPRAHLDARAGLGCTHLLRTLWRVRPRLHVFGHVHEGAGTETLRYDGLQEAYERTVVEGGGVWNLVRTVVRFVLLALLRPAAAEGEAETLLVNAAVVGGLRDDERREPVKVVI